jgi:hypothetical protein
MFKVVVLAFVFYIFLLAERTQVTSQRLRALNNNDRTILQLRLDSLKRRSRVSRLIPLLFAYYSGRVQQRSVATHAETSSLHAFRVEDRWIPCVEGFVSCLS